ncbi:cell division protein FtsI (penicillin-binding protein 3) [Chitinivorax tropicus]|uniref:Peptidoglycan D,D-transpeptidase FtsI n=1 Tax=Chitinivorax tropicus TaxID=714531 RepID=A0A840MPA1_9PROT|nr:penicillin-binding protein 2 [Chitinivorax tropicus]MBB5018847.1 cell division protein FtsI (penicillin-binding protein 3) [Chitinivorax tropicus]
MYTANTNLNARLPAWRSYVLMAALGAGFAALVGRAVYLQGFNRDFLQEQGEARYSRVMKLEPVRGMITDRNGEPLAISTPVQSIWASPSDMDALPNDEQLGKLAKLLGAKADDLKKKLADGRKKDFVYLRRQLHPEVAEKVMALGIPGIYKMREYRRYYPAGEVLAHVIGQTGIDDQGQEGIELTRNGVLAGKPGSRHVLKDRRGYIVEDVTNMKPPVDGQTLTLSIDRNLQYLAYRELKAAVEENKAKAGGAVILDAHTGEVLALANVPSYNPNNRGVIDMARKRNRVLTDLYEPGSTMKPFTAAAALEAGTFKPSSIINVAGGMSFGKYTIHDAHPHGALTVEQVIQVSSNIGAAKMALSLDREYYYDYLRSLGFGQPPHTGFPGEASGRVRHWKTIKPVETATTSYGHGISVSLVQMARAYMIFANDGEIKPISFLKQVAPPPGQQVISKANAEAMKKMLEMVTQPGGTATRAQVVGYRVGGKTGTANKLEGGGYSKSKYVASFVGIAPISNPRLVVAVMIDEPGGGTYYGGTVSAPVFSRITTAALRSLAVPNDAPVNNIILPNTDPQEAIEGTM